MSKIFLMLVIFIVPIIGCESKTQDRHYEEIVIEAPIQNPPMMTNDPHAQVGLNISKGGENKNQESDLTWEVPQGWQELAGGGMRVATFKRMDDLDAIDVSIVSLGGTAGGLQANLTRWALQIDIDPTRDESEFSRWMDTAGVFKTKNGLDAKVFDYSKLQKDADPSAKSMIASMIQTDEATVFIKMTGTVKTVNENLESFKALTQSVRPK